MKTQPLQESQDSYSESVQTSGFYSADSGTKLAVGTIVLISALIYIPPIYDVNIEVLNLPWLFIAAGTGQAILLVVALVSMYVLAGE